jgi:hypothetical protein
MSVCDVVCDDDEEEWNGMEWNGMEWAVTDHHAPNDGNDDTELRFRGSKKKIII